MNKEVQNRISGYWNDLYPQADNAKFTRFINMVDEVKRTFTFSPQPQGWYKDAVVYAAYVDLFNNTFQGLNDKLDHLQELGITCLWLLPVLESPMRDAGFDIRDYRNIRAELFGLPEDTPKEVKQAEFRKFLDNAHKHGIKVIFDIAMNHTSEEHPWFTESRKGPENPYRDYYIWNKDTNLYKETRLLFKGMVPSNWEKDGEWYFFHRFFEFQPDLNYRNPDVLTEITAILLFWLQQGLDGFRADAIPYLWKEDGTDCENLPQTHTILKVFRAVLDYIRPNTLLLAEACQPPKEVVKYFGENDECHAGYHFPLMPMIFKSLAIENPEPIQKILHPDTTPPIGPDNQWFMFLRLHDELTLEMVTPGDRAIIHNHYCKKPEWDFRVGEGISARLSELLDRNPEKIALAYSIMFTLPGTPIIYYGDEFAKFNDEEFFRQYKEMTGKEDSRYLVRGYLDWNRIEANLKDKNSISSKILETLKKMVYVRSGHPEFSRGDLRWISPDNSQKDKILAFERSLGEKKITVVHNLSHTDIVIEKDFLNGKGVNLLTGLPVKFPLSLKPYEFAWIA